MIKLQIVIIKLLQILLTQTKLILVSNLFNDKNNSQFSLEPVEGSSNLFTINPYNPQQVLIKGSTMTFPNGNTYYLNDPDLSYFITNTHFDNLPQNSNIIYSF